MKSPVKTFNEYKALRLWTKVDFDSYYWAQCVDLIKDWGMYIGKPIDVYWNANVLWTLGLWKNWKRVNNSMFAKPRVGDIICYDVGVYWHIAIAWQSSFSWVEILEQNAVDTNKNLWRTSWDWIWENAIRLKKDNYKNCVGWFTPNV